MPLITVADAKAQLQIQTADTSQDTQLQGFVNAANELIDAQCGPSTPTQYTELLQPSSRSAPYWRTFTVSHAPVISVTSITPAQGAGIMPLDLANLVINGPAGLLIVPGTVDGLPYNVVYTAGRASSPPSLVTAAMIMVRYLWETRRSGGVVTNDIGGDETTVIPELGYAVPNRALQLMRMTGNIQLPGIA